MKSIAKIIKKWLEQIPFLGSDSSYAKERFTRKYQKCKNANKKKVLGEGGNAIVYHVKNRATGEKCALKFLKTTKKEKQIRFTEEIETILDNYNIIDGILPIKDYDKKEFWYTMPIAIPVMDYIKLTSADIVQIVKDFSRLIDTFVELHAKKITHRDIKPDNIYFYDGRYFIGDFGLVDYPEKEHDFTKSDQPLGAVFTMAPEMRRNPRSVKDARKADVYSLAKTLWMLITGDNKGFDGQYSYTNQMYALRLKDKYCKTHLAELELLLVDSTKDNPKDRPSITEFKEQIDLWLNIQHDTEKAAVSDWNFLNKLIFKGDEAVTTSWSNPHRIVEILNYICKLPTQNHVMFSSRGGLDMTNASIATEVGCICLNFGMGITSILKPKMFHYNTFADSSWNYFLLEADKLKPVFQIPTEDESETLVEDYPGHYVEATYFDYGVYDYDLGNKLPPTARRIERHVKGSFLIVLKCGEYNAIPDTYDGRHSECKPAEFREYMESLIRVLNNPRHTSSELKAVVNSLRKESLFDLSTEDITAKSLAPDDFVKKNYHTWNFADCIPSTKGDHYILLYAVRVYPSSMVDFFQTKDEWILNDGTIGKESQNSKRFFFDDRIDLINSLKAIEAKVDNYAKADGYDAISPFDDIRFEIDIKRIGKPTHLFTKDEIEILMRGADDRHSNQLVVDEYGYAHLLTEANQGQFYPVSNETWHAGNNYVGKYSPLSTLDSYYIDSLVCWLRFLKTGERQYCDFNHSADIQETIKEIRKYY